VEAVMTRGEATWNEQVHLRVERHGYPEDAYFTWSYSPIPDDAGGIGGLLATVTEETARVRTEQELVETERRLDSALINDVLAFAKLEAGQVEFDLRPLPAADLLASVEPLVGALASTKGIALSTRAGPSPLRVLGDEERVRQILLNLVSNVIKYTPAGGWVVLTGERDGTQVAIRVRDNGPGIPQEQQQRIFDAFVQVGRRLNHPQEGVGLGLAISRDLARAMGGDLHVESTPGNGSTFTLRLPFSG
jgi:signal transduction histidine kinase